MKKITTIPRTIDESLDCAFTSLDNLQAMEQLAEMEAWQFLQQSMEDDIITKIDNIFNLCDDPVKNRDAILVEKAVVSTLTKLLHLKNATINRKPQLRAEIARLMAAKIQKQRESA